MQIKDNSRSNKTTVIMAIVAFVLQVALSSQIEICGGCINFMLILACALAFSGDSRRATIAGFCCGLAYDLTASVPIGLMALLLTVACYFSNGFFHGIQVGLNANALRCAAIVIFGVDFIYGILLFFMGIQTDIFWAIVGHGLSTSVLTFIVCIPFFYFAGVATPQTGFTARPRGKGSRLKSLH